MSKKSGKRHKLVSQKVQQEQNHDQFRGAYRYGKEKYICWSKTNQKRYENNQFISKKGIVWESEIY